MKIKEEGFVTAFYSVPRYTECTVPGCPLERKKQWVFFTGTTECTEIEGRMIELIHATRTETPGYTRWPYPHRSRSSRREPTEPAMAKTFPPICILWASMIIHSKSQLAQARKQAELRVEKIEKHRDGPGGCWKFHFQPQAAGRP